LRQKRQRASNTNDACYFYYTLLPKQMCDTFFYCNTIAICIDPIPCNNENKCTLFFYTCLLSAMLYTLVDKRITNNKKIHGNKYYTQFFRQGQFLFGPHSAVAAVAVAAAANSLPTQRLAFLRAP